MTIFLDLITGRIAIAVLAVLIVMASIPVNGTGPPSQAYGHSFTTQDTADINHERSIILSKSVLLGNLPEATSASDIRRPGPTTDLQWFSLTPDVLQFGVNTAAGSIRGSQGQQTDASLLRAAQDGAQQGIADAESDGISITDEQRQAALLGAELGATFVSQNLTGLNESFAGSPTPAHITPEIVRLSARGAVYGALAAANRRTVNATVISTTTAGGVLGGSLATAAVTSQGGEVTDEQIQFAAQGGSEGATAAVSSITANQTLRVGSGHLMFAAFGGAGGALAAAGLFPTFGQQVNSMAVYAAAYGSASGSVKGVHAREAPIQTDPLQTASVALGASGGAVSATLSNPELSPQQIFEGAERSASETLGRPDIAPDQYAEAAITASIEHLTDEPTTNAIFPQPIQLGTYLAITPQDTDGDGLYEDVNGNSILSYTDVVMLSIIINSGVTLTTEQRQAFDFNDDSVLDERDVHALDIEITGGPYADNETEG